MKLACCLLAVLAAACAAPASPTPLPSAFTDRAPGPSSAVAMSGSARPCRYDHSFFTVMHESMGTLVMPGHEQVRITYNAAGLDVVEAAVDDANRFSFGRSFEYDAMGHLAHEATTRATDPGRVEHAWLVYDSFGRLIRSSTDLDGDGGEDTVVTYGYAGTGNPISARVASAQGGAAYDRTYRYDDDARLVEVDRDDGPGGVPDGVIDQISRYQYDDARRVTTMVATDRAGAIRSTSTTTYDLHDHVLSVTGTELDASGTITSTSRDIYTYEAGRLVSEAYDNSAVLGSTARYDWQYDHCQ